MRLYVFLFCAAVFGLSPNTTVFSQTEKITIAQDKSYSADEVFDLIKSQTEYSFIYQEDLFNNVPTVFLNKGEIKMNTLLEKVLASKGFECFFMGDNAKRLIINKIPKNQTQRRISGRITDTDGVLILGVNVVVYREGTPIRGVASDFDGNYSVEVSRGDSVQFSAIGYFNETILIEDQLLLNVVLRENVNVLDEVVVTTGYQNISESRVSGSFEKVTLDELSRERTSDNLFDIIQNEIPGLRRTTTSAGNTLDIRGQSTFGLNGATSEPLVIIDGFRIQGELRNRRADDSGVLEIIEKINPNDVESITVLKDAAAASIWGAEAADGVIVITTKKGQKGSSPKVTLNTSLQLRRKPDFTTANFASVDTSLNLVEFGVNNGFVFNFGGLDIEPAAATYFDLNNGLISQAEADARINSLRQNNYIDEYSNLFLRDFVQRRHNVSISHATDKVSYFASFAVNDENSTDLGVDLRRYNGNLNLSTELFKGVRLSTIVRYSLEEGNNNAAEGLGSRPLYDRILDEDGNFLNMFSRGTRSFAFRQSEADGGRTAYEDVSFNIARDRANTFSTTNIENIDFGANLDIDLFKDVTAQFSYNRQQSKRMSETFSNEETFFVRSTVNNSAIFIPEPFFGPRNFDPNGGPFGNGFGLPQGNILNNRVEGTTESNGIRGQLNYTGYVDKNNKHFVTAIAGMDFSQIDEEQRTLRDLFGYDPQLETNIDVDLVNVYELRDFPSRLGFGNSAGSILFQKNRFLATYTNASYSYDGKYTLTGSWRLDDSNLFGSSPRFRNVPLWSAGAKWIIAKEDFFKVPFVDRLDLRATIGTGGSINNSAIPFLSLLLDTDRQTLTPNAGILNVENQELRWETTRTVNLGLDFGLFKGKLSGSFQYYDRFSSDVLIEESTNGTFGFNSLVRNNGEISNTGFEVSLNYNILNTRNFSWSSTFTMSHNQNRLVDFDPPFEPGLFQRVSSTQFILGDPISGIYTFRYAGLDENGAPQIFDRDDNILSFTDNATIDDIAFQGQLEPRYFGIFNKSIRYKNLSFNAQFFYEFGHVFRRNSISYQGLQFDTPFHSDIENRWQNPGDEAITNVPAFPADFEQFFGGNYTNYYLFSDALVEDAASIRLQSVSLNYDLGGDIFKNSVIDNINIGVNARDLGLIWTANGDGIDPQLSNGVGLPRQNATFAFNVNVSF